MSKTLIGILDVGKTHTKFIVADADSGRIAAQHERASRSIEGPVIRALDVVGIERWLRETLSAFPDKAAIEALVPVAHGAAAVLLDSEDQVHFAPDYEDHAFELVAETYRTQRDPFSETFSPFLPLGLNMGRQLYLSRVLACDAVQAYPVLSALPAVLGLADVRREGERSDVSRLSYRSVATAGGQTLRARRPQGLEPHASCATGRHRTRWVACRQSLCAQPDWTRAVASSAAFMTPMPLTSATALGAQQRSPSRWSRVGHGSSSWRMALIYRACVSRDDMLANVDALGHAVPTARFMGGREYEAILGPSDAPVVPTHDALASILRRRAFALPPARAASERSGFAGRLIRTEGLKGEERAALATAYLALRTDRRLSDLGATGDILVDGPLSANRLYVELLANLRPECPIRLCDARSGVVRASLVLAGIRPRAAEYFHFALSDPLREFLAYKSEWTDLAYPHT